MRQLPRAETEAPAKREVRGTHLSHGGHAGADGAREGQQQGDGTSGQSLGKSGTPGKSASQADHNRVSGQDLWIL